MVLPIDPTEIREITVDIDPPGSVLSVSAHPDDTEIHCGATLAKWSESGTDVHIVVATDGSKGTWDVSADLDLLVATRQEEQRNAASVLGARGQVGFCGYVDGELVHDRDSVKELTRWIRELKPDIVITHDPWRRYRLHPDHRAIANIVTDAVVAARDPHFFADLGPHHRPDEIWYFESEEIHHIETFSKAHFDKKMASLEEHKSQLVSTMGYENDEDPARKAWVEMMEKKAVGVAKLVGASYGESFTKIAL